MIRPTPVIFKKLDTQEEYMDMVAKFSWLVNFDLEKAEKMMEENNINDLAQVLPRIAVNVLVIRNFREGFLDAFPQRTGIQRDLYANQDHFEDRVYKLVEFLNSHQDSLPSYLLHWKYLLGSLLPGNVL